MFLDQMIDKNKLYDKQLMTSNIIGLNQLF